MALQTIPGGATYTVTRRRIREMFTELYAAADLAGTSLDLSGTLDVTGATTLDSTLNVVGAMTTTADLDIGTTLDVTGDTTLDAGLTVAGAAVIFSALPTADPVVAGQIWNNSGVVTVSTGV